MKIMNGKLQNINLHGESHAIEVANFAITFSGAFDAEDAKRFCDKEKELMKFFPHISKSENVKLMVPAQNLNEIASQSSTNLSYFAYNENDDSDWIGFLGNNQIAISCRKYTKWNSVWKDAKERLEAFLECIAPDKPISSINYGVTDTFNAKRSDEILIPSNIFRKNEYIALRIANGTDPRWDFSEGWYEGMTENDHVLVRLEAKSGISEDKVITSINNMHSRIFKPGIGIEQLLKKGANHVPQAELVFDHLHNKNKRLMRKIFVDELLDRMGLESENV